jgi:HAD superfamily hydrolase (TIGR01509 family)
MNTIEAVVFDCDGVLVDSERINNEVFTELATRAGLPTTFQASVDRYMGRSTVECVAEIEFVLGRHVGFDFAAEYERQVLQRQQTSLTAISGVHDLLGQLTAAGVPICVASSGTPSEIAFRLAATGLDHYFGSRCYSASQVARGKPAPDLFLLAADKIGVDPNRCALIEDSRYGVPGGRAAGMHVIGYAALASPHALRIAGADHVITAMAEAPRVLGVQAGVPPLLAGRAERVRVQEQGSATGFSSADCRAGTGAERHA